MKLHRHPLALALSLATLSACANTAGEHAVDATAAEVVPGQAEEQSPDQEKLDKLEKLEHDLQVRSSKLAIAEMKIQGDVLQREQRLAHLRADLAMAEAKLQNFVAVTLPSRKARAELDLRGARDFATEAAEELRQIEIMYEEQDLADKTAEFVVSRGQRRADRAARRIAIQEAEVASLVAHELPQEQMRHEQTVKKAAEALGTAEHDSKVALAREELELMEARMAVQRAEKALQKAREGDEE